MARLLTTTRMKQVLKLLGLLFIGVFLTEIAVARADQEEYAGFCSATQTDDCIGVSRDGSVFDFFERRLIGKATISTMPNGVVAKFGDAYFCGKSDSRISRSYLICGPVGWQIPMDSINLADPWNPTDLFKNDH